MLRRCDARYADASDAAEKTRPSLPTVVGDQSLRGQNCPNPCKMLSWIEGYGVNEELRVKRERKPSLAMQQPMMPALVLSNKPAVCQPRCVLSMQRQALGGEYVQLERHRAPSRCPMMAQDGRGTEHGGCTKHINLVE